MTYFAFIKGMTPFKSYVLAINLGDFSTPHQRLENANDATK